MVVLCLQDLLSLVQHSELKLQLVVILLRLLIIVGTNCFLCYIFILIWTAVSDVLALFNWWAVVCFQNILNIDILVIDSFGILNHVTWNAWVGRNLHSSLKTVNRFGLTTLVFFLRCCKIVLCFWISFVLSLVIRIFPFHHWWYLIGWWLQELVNLWLSLMLNWIIPTLSSTLAYRYSSASRVATLLIRLNPRLWSIRPSTWCSELLLVSFAWVFDVFTLNILQIDFFIVLLTFIQHHVILVVLLLSVSVVTLSSLMPITSTFGGFSRLVLVRLPSRVSLLGLFWNFLFFFVLLHLSLVHFNVVLFIFSWNVRICWLLTSVMKSRFSSLASFFFILLFFLLEFLLSLICKIYFDIFLLFFLAIFSMIRLVVIGFDISLVVFDLTCNFGVIYTFEILFNSLFAVLWIQCRFHLVGLQFDCWSLLNSSLVFNLNSFLRWVIRLKFHECISVRFQMSNHVLFQQKVICSC